MVRVCAVALLVLLALLPAQARAQGSSEGRWFGSVRLNADEMPIELQVSSGRVSIYLPEMLWSSDVDAATTDTAVRFEMPFGLGAADLILLHEGQVLASAAPAPAYTLRRDDRQRHTVQDVMVPTPNGNLAGTLYLPVRSAPVRAVVLAGGAAAQSRTHSSVTSWCRYFVRLHFACLVTDRRPDGSGHPTSDLERDTAELQAAIQYVRGRREVDPQQVGLAGFSRGAWPVLRVAATDHALSFVLLTGASLSTPAEAETASVEARMKAAGASQPDIEAVRAYYALYFETARDPSLWPELDRAARAAEQASWGQFADQPLKPEDMTFWQRNCDFSIVGDLALVRVPVLALWGANDTISPPAVQAPLLLSGASHALTIVYPRADHPIETPAGSDELGVWRWPSKAPGLLADVETWLTQVLSD